MSSISVGILKIFGRINKKGNGGNSVAFLRVVLELHLNELLGDGRKQK